MTALDFPANPTVGQVFGRWTFDGIAWTLNPSEASLGNGIVGFGESAGTIPLTTTPVDLLTTPVTFNAVAGRRYLLMGVGAMSSGASIISLLTIHSNIAGEGDVASGSSTGGAGLTFPQAVALAIYAPAVTGPVSLMLRGASASGTGNSVQSSSAPRFLMVEDITPSAGGPGGPDDLPWTPVVFQNGWQNFAPGFETAAYRFAPRGMVELKGLISGGVGNGSTAFTMGPAYANPNAVVQHHAMVALASPLAAIVGIGVSGEANVFAANVPIDIAGQYWTGHTQL